MKKLVLVLSILLSVNVVYADAPYIPAHLLNSSNQSKPQKVDCNSSSSFGFIPNTIPDECKPEVKEGPVEVVQPQSQTQVNQKINKFLNTFLY